MSSFILTLRRFYTLRLVHTHFRLYMVQTDCKVNWTLLKWLKCSAQMKAWGSMLEHLANLHAASYDDKLQQKIVLCM